MKVASKKKIMASGKVVPKKPSKAELEKEIKAKEKQDKLELAKPEIIMPALTESEKQRKAVEDDKRFRELETSTRKNFVEMMFLLREIKVYELWRYIDSAKSGKPFQNFDKWLAEAAPTSRANGYAALRSAEKLLPAIPRKELEQMPRFSMQLLTQVPKLKLDNPVIREAAKTQSRKELVKTIQKHAPEAHIEEKKVVSIDMSAQPVIADALQAAADLNGLQESEAFEFICTDWLDSACQIEQYAGMSNRQAWNQWKQGNAIDEFASEREGAAV